MYWPHGCGSKRPVICHTRICASSAALLISQLIMQSAAVAASAVRNGPVSRSAQTGKGWSIYDSLVPRATAVGVFAPPAAAVAAIALPRKLAARAAHMLQPHVGCCQRAWRSRKFVPRMDPWQHCQRSGRGRGENRAITAWIDYRALPLHRISGMRVGEHCAGGKGDAGASGCPE